MAAGASYADLRIHAITTEHIQLRDGELEAAVVNREIGLAVRVIVDGTWGFASHAELEPSTAAETARRAVHVAATLKPLNAERVELASEPVYSNVSFVFVKKFPNGAKVYFIADAYSGNKMKDLFAELSEVSGRSVFRFP